MKNFYLLKFSLFSIVPALVFAAVEDWSFRDAFYFTIITLLTIGFGDFTPTAGIITVRIVPYDTYRIAYNL